MSKSASNNENGNAMNHSGNSKLSKRKSLLKFLSKKSTKVEPDNSLFENSNSSSNDISVTPALIYTNEQFELSSSIDNHHDKTVSSSSSNSVMPICCSLNNNVDEQKLLPPNPNNLPRQSPKNQNITFNLDKSKSLDHFKTTSAISNKRTIISKDERARPLSFIQAHKSINNDDGLIMTQSDHSIEYQSSIAMQHSRSRLRERLLPPGYKNEQSVIKCLSSPDIAENEETDYFKGNRSNSMESVNYASTAIHRLNSSGTNSLARQALMAADVLHLIPTERARERSYLAGRLGSISLLGKWQLERVMPTREVKIFVGTWNMNGESPPRQMNDFVLPLGVEHVPDIVAIGTQESSSERFEWEVILQETLGPSHILLHSTSLGTLHLAVFIRRDLIWYCSVPEDDCLSVRPGSAFRTKGAVAISFCLFGTSMLFVTSHLTAHQQKVKERVQDIKRIIHALDLPRNLPIRKNKDVTQNFDSVYWCGDLNFRLSEPREKLMKWIENTKFPLPSHLPHGYMHTDQLSAVLSEGAAFKGFREANITFPPTYKYDPGTQQFDTSSKQRAPAYTDRILYKYRRPLSALRRGSGALSNSHFPPSPVECIAYDSVPSIITSDHKPVWGLFKNYIQPGIDTIPLAAGLFNRDVYLEGMRRRLNNNDSGASAVCVIQ